MILILARDLGLADGVRGGLEAAGREVLIQTDVDVTSMRSVRGVVEQRRPQAVLHLAFIDDPARCESNPDEAFLHNAESVINLAAATLEFKAVPVIWSPAQVLAGAGHRAEADDPQPTSTWTESRIRGEVFLRRATPKGLVLRSGPIVSPDLSREAERLRTGITVGSAQVQPVLAAWFGRVLDAALTAELSGILHLTSEGPIRPEHEFWLELARHLDLAESRVNVDPLGGAGNAVLTSDRTAELALDALPPAWTTALSEVPAPTSAAPDGPLVVTTEPSVWVWSLAPGAPERWTPPRPIIVQAVTGKAFVEAGDEDWTLKPTEQRAVPAGAALRVTVPEPTVLIVVGVTLSSD